jgi:hypothetical protein
MGCAGSYRLLDLLLTNKSHDLHDFIVFSYNRRCATTQREVGQMGPRASRSHLGRTARTVRWQADLGLIFGRSFQSNAIFPA